MTKKEMVEHNIDVAFDFMRHVLKHPNVLDQIPNGATIEFVQKEIPIRERKGQNGKRKFVKVTRNFQMI
ncbi:MAG: hypothetical protein HY961_13175 [Ignavibacteriae bacterium]|nr:hypothetical protein [Ignavibacteriota bacterium]